MQQRCAPTVRIGARPCATRTDRPRRVRCRGGRGVAGPIDRRSHRSRRGTRCLWGPAGTCGRSPTVGHNRSRRRRSGVDRWTGRHRHEGNAGSSGELPTSAAGLTRPPLVGTWVSDTSATSWRCRNGPRPRRRRPGRWRRSALGRSPHRVDGRPPGTPRCSPRTRGRGPRGADPCASVPTRTQRSRPLSHVPSGRSRAGEHRSGR